MSSRLGVKLMSSAVAAAALSLVAPQWAAAASAPLSHAYIADHLDLATHQQPENIALEPDGSVDLSMSIARQIVRVGCDGELHVLATVPAPADGGVHTPVLGFPLVTGLVRSADGTLYFLYATGTSDLTGVWRIRPGGAAERIAALPASSFPNGLGLDEAAGRLYVADSTLSTVWQIPVAGGTATAWATGPELSPAGFLGANGLKVHEGAVWVTNLDKGTVIRISLMHDGTAGTPQVKATNLVGIDDFAFIGHSDRIVAALNGPNEVALIEPDGSHSIVLTAQDGLEGPTSIAIRHHTVYVASASYFLGKDPNLLIAHLR